MTWKYRELMQIHTVQSQGPCRDLAFVIPKDTAGHLARARMLARPEPGVLRLLLALDHAKAPLAPPGFRARLRVGLQLIDPRETSLWALDHNPRDHTLLFRCAQTIRPLACKSEAELRHVEWFEDAPVPFIGPRYSPASDKAARLHGPNNLLLEPTTQGHFELCHAPPGRYLLHAGRAEPTTLYFDPDLRTRPIFAIAELDLDLTPLGSESGGVWVWTLPFATRERVLHYVIVARGFSDAELEQLEIKDMGVADDPRTEIVFGPATAPTCAPEHPGARLVSFTSTTGVTQSTRPPRRLQLRARGSVLVPNLPMPGPDTKAEVLIHLTKP